MTDELAVNATYDGAQPIPLTLHLVAVAHADDGGDGNPWTQWALVGEAEDAAGVVVESWARDDTPKAQVLAAVFRSLRLGGGLGGF